MRLLFIVLIALAAFAFVQSYRHHCKFGLEKAWFDCVMGKTAAAPEAAAPTAAPEPAPAPAPAPAPTPAPAQ
jgi:hypothetical protein